MPLIDVECVSCQTVAEVLRPLSMWPETPPCPACQGPTTQIHLPPGYDRTFPDAVVVYRTPSGEYRFPGQSSGSATAKYEAMGYQRVEARGWAEVRALESKLNRVEYDRACRANERLQAREESETKVRRSELYRRMNSMSEAGRQFSRAYLRMRDHRAKPGRAHEPGLHIDAYSNSKGSR